MPGPAHVRTDDGSGAAALPSCCDTINALLGSNPQGAYATLVARLTAAVWQAAAVNQVALTAKGALGQTANLQEWLTSADAVLASISPAGWLVTPLIDFGDASYMTATVLGPGHPTWMLDGATASQISYFQATGTLALNVPGMTFGFNDTFGCAATRTTDGPGILVAGAAAQTANLQEWRNSAAVTLAKVSAAGAISSVTKMYPGTPANALQTAAGIYAGTGAPNNANGANGDFYLRFDGGALTTIYQRRAGAWVGIT